MVFSQDGIFSSSPVGPKTLRKSGVPAPQLSSASFWIRFGANRGPYSVQHHRSKISLAASTDDRADDIDAVDCPFVPFDRAFVFSAPAKPTGNESCIKILINISRALSSSSSLDQCSTLTLNEKNAFISAQASKFGDSSEARRRRTQRSLFIRLFLSSLFF